MKYVSTVLLLTCSILTLSTQAFADDAPCTQDLVSLGKCTVQDVAKDLKKADEKLAIPVHEAKLHVDAAGRVTLDMADSAKIHLQKAIAEPFKDDFKDLRDEDNQDLYHAGKDIVRSTGKVGENIGKGIWHGLEKVGGGIHEAALVIKADEIKGFKDHPNTDEDLVGFINSAGHGAKHIFIDMGDGVYKRFEKVKGAYKKQLDYVSEEPLRDFLATAKSGATPELESPVVDAEIPMEAINTMEGMSSPLKPVEAHATVESKASPYGILANSATALPTEEQGPYNPKQ
jgi:hypothetical protein